MERTDAFVLVPKEKLTPLFPLIQSSHLTVLEGDQSIPFQWVDNGTEQGLVLVFPNFKEFEKKIIHVIYDEQTVPNHNFTKRTQAELSHKVGGYFENRKYVGGNFQNVQSLKVPSEHTDHSWYIRYEGPGWESDKVGYRFYLDWRNGVDVFGKKVSEPILQVVGQDGFDSYHEMQDWGMDVLKVGKTLGVGSIAAFHQGKAVRVEQTDSLYAEILQNGVLYSAVETHYYGWQVGGRTTDLFSQISISAGSRLSKQHIRLSNELDNIATGLIKDRKAELMVHQTDQGYGYLATYGPQSLNDDLLGIAIIFKQADVLEVTADELSHVVVLKPSSQEISYYFLAAWELEPEGRRTKEAFENYLNQTIWELSNPIKVKIN